VHLPLALAPDGEKLSKRHGAVSVRDGGAQGDVVWRALRFLGQDIPEALRPASPREILAWGVRNFALERVPQRGSVPGD
jgi:glutamyl-Q tRNA(Asp) synthetase